ncbi:MAG TPA: ATP-binding protein [Streptosporangiaceae bacterium]|nr:ATP-binding protein [Streptosporangiaceae bacterium]
MTEGDHSQRLAPAAGGGQPPVTPASSKSGSERGTERPRLIKPRGSITSQLLVGFSVFAVLIGTAAAAGYVAVTRQDEAAKELTSQYQVLQRTEINLQSGFAVAQSTLLLYSVTGQHEYLVPVSLSETEFTADVATLTRNATPDLRTLIAKEAWYGANWFSLATRIGTVTPRTAGAKSLMGQWSTLSLAFTTNANATQQRLQTDIAQLTDSSTKELNAGLAGGGAALAVAVLLLLMSSLSTLRTVTRPLRGLTATVSRLTAGDHAARAPLSGSAEVREVAMSVNTLADESDRMRAQEAETDRLLSMARAVGLRIREHLVAADVLNEARTALEENLDAEAVYLRLLEGDKLGPLIGHGPGWFLPAEAISVLTPTIIDEHTSLFRAHTSKVIQDVQGPEGEAIPPEIRDAYRAAGVVSHLLTPFGVGTDVLGIIVANRLHPGQPWTDAEVSAVEWIAADLGRGLHYARMYEAENRLVGELRSVDRTKSDFLATVSHELRTPLTSIAGYVELLREGESGPLTPAQEKMLQTVGRNTARLRNLIEDVLTLSNIESGAFTRTMQPVDLADIVVPAVAALEPQAVAKGLMVSLDCPDQRLVVRGDPEQLDRVLMNLLSNAVKFTAKGGAVQIETGRDDGMAVLTIVDTGMGIPEGEQKDLFTRFFRASNAVDRAVPGTGLGLAIVRTIVISHSGDIEIRSRLGEGTTVNVRIPLLAAGRGRQARLQAGQPVVPADEEFTEPGLGVTAPAEPALRTPASGLPTAVTSQP